MQAKSLRCLDGLDLPDNTHLRDIGWERLYLLVRVTGFVEVKGARVPEGEKTVRIHFPQRCMEFQHVFLVYIFRKLVVL